MEATKDSPIRFLDFHASPIKPCKSEGGTSAARLRNYQSVAEVTQKPIFDQMFGATEIDVKSLPLVQRLHPALGEGVCSRSGCGTMSVLSMKGEGLAGRRERAVETDRCGPDAGQTDAAGRV